MQVFCIHCSRTFDLKKGSTCEYCHKRNEAYE